jgi:putative two-component system response regulator
MVTVVDMDRETVRTRTTLLLVDDDHQVLETLLLLISAHGYRVIAADSASEALQRLDDRDVQVVLTDIRMPGMDGIELAGRIHERDPDLPVLIMTAYAELDVAVEALKGGVFDFIFKPFRTDQLIHAIDKAATFSSMKVLERNYHQALETEVKKKTKELQDLSQEIIHRLTMIAEYRDSTTGMHVSRIGRFSALLAESLGMPSDFVEHLTLACSLHDIGKVAIPDDILLKPGYLTDEEFGIIKSHAVLGARMLAGSSHDIVRMAESIALHHHERWDGSGYPHALRGEDIPLEGRIVALADQYDALRAQRPYKKPLSHSQTCRIILEGDTRTRPEHFDPRVLAAFKRCEAEFARIFDEMRDD